MKIIVDENIAFANEAFSQFGEVVLLHGRKINNEILNNADVLIVRSITNVNKDLLENSSVKFVGTATIGIDHIDLDYLHKNNIQFTDAKGCNADAVAEYVFTALTCLAVQNDIGLEGKTLGVAGVGNIGSRVVRLAENAGLKVLKNDPPVQRKTGSNDFVTFNEILKADIITLHVPLNTKGIDKTVHLLNSEILSQLKDGAILINASRGQVTDNKALLEVIDNKKLQVVLDVWENEPAINNNLLEKVKIGTPHIAGYSLEGKVNGTKIIYDALCKYYGHENTWRPKLPPVKNPYIDFENKGNPFEDMGTVFNRVYNIKRDDKELKKMIWVQESERASYFDVLRKNYHLRREFNNYTVKLNKKDEKVKPVLEGFRFKTEIPV
ncbi:MAG: 4-phosphoerythronate dehydrogenase [Ignavibacteriaceae bacterium]